MTKSILGRSRLSGGQPDLTWLCDTCLRVYRGETGSKYLGERASFVLVIDDELSNCALVIPSESGGRAAPEVGSVPRKGPQGTVS